MKTNPLLDEKVNIYDSEMSKETIESYEKYYKNQNECDTACDKEKELDCDGANKTDERIGNDVSNDSTEKMTVNEINDCDGVNKTDEGIGNDVSNDSTEKMTVTENLDCDDVKKVDKRVGHDWSNDTKQKMSEKYDCDGVNKADEGVRNDLSNDAAQKTTVTEKCDNCNDSENKDTDRKRIRNAETASEGLPCKKRKKEFEPPKLREENRDIFCWRCHKYVVETDGIPCYFCPRIYHLKCVHIHIQEKPSGFWLCTECDAISAAENPDKISSALSKLQKKDLAELLMFVLKRMRQHEGSSHYENPVDLESYPDYKDYIVKPMYLTLLENNVKNLKYSSCESFLADTKWMVHNSYVFNTVHSELTLYAKAMMKNAKHECDEIINCPDCYLHANTLEDDKWFIEPCDKPHVLVWARLKGFPYWPCKVMKANGTNVDVRFFGDHNKSLVPVECCYLYSKQMPSKQKKVDELEVAIKEASRHIKRLEERFHVFQYAPLKTMYNPKEEDEQRKLLLPYHDKPFFIKVKDREKLFDPDVINNIFDDPLSFHKADLKEESKTNPISESPNALEIKNKKIILKPHNEELSPYRLPSTLNIKNMKSSPCNKPTIIIEDTDSDVLSQNSFNHSKQPIIISCEKPKSSLCYSNKAKFMIVNDKHINSALPIEHMDHDNSILEITKDSNPTQKNNNFKNKKVVIGHLTKERDDAIDDNQIDLIRDNNVLSENSKSDDKHVSFTSEQANCLPLTNPSLDKYNNNHSSDKLRINYNAKLINILNDNPALINNLFKPMVVIKKLDDQILFGYSNTKRKNDIIAADKKGKTDENRSSKISSSDNENNVTLNFDLLNGDLNKLVSLTEIDLDKDESMSQTCLTNNKEEEEEIKSEKMDVDEQVDSDYIERLSKSILDSTLDYNDVHCVKENAIFHPDIKNGSYERILVVDKGNHALKKDEAITRSNNCNNQSSPNQVIDLEIVEDIEKLNTQKSNGITKSIINDDLSVVDPIKFKSDLNNKAIYLCEKEGIRFQDQDMFSAEENEDEISLKSTSEIKSNEASKTGFTHSLENKKIIIENGKISNSDENIEFIESNKKCQSRVFEIIKNDILLPNEEKNCYKRDNSEIASCSNIANDYSIIKEREIHHTVEREDSILEKNAKGSKRDSDCEIVKIVLPSNSKILKPIGFKRVKTSGGVIKKVIKNGMLVAAAGERQHLKILTKENGVDIKKLCTKTKFDDESLKQLNNHAKVVKTYPASSRRPTCIKGPIDLKNVLENCADNMVSGTERIREEDKVMNLEINAILNKVEKIEAKGELLDVLREELEKFEEHCKSKIESYKNAYIEEMDSLYTMEKQRWIQETMNVSENESKMMVDEIKKKQWCILCLNEAKFHCCWSTSYCSEKCQLADWPVHMKTCTQYSMRIGDPDLRLSPELKKIFKGEQDFLNKKIKDVLQSDKFMDNTTKASSSSPSCSSSSVVNSSEVASKESIHTSPKSSTVYVQKSVSKQDTTRGSENPGNQVMKIVSNQAVYFSGTAAPPNQTKNLINVPKQNHLAKPNALIQDQTSTEMSGKHVLFTVPLANRNRINAQTSVEKTLTSNKPSGNSFSSHNSPIVTGGQQIIVPKSFLPTKVIKKTVPLVAHKNVNCVQDNNNSAFANARPLYISLQNISKDNSKSSDEGLRDPLEMTNETRLNKEKPKLLFERNSSSRNRDTNNKPPQSFLIVEKSGETAQYTYKIGFKEDVEKMTQASLMSPFGKKSTVCAVQPLSYPVVCNPSTSTETSSSAHMKN